MKPIKFAEANVNFAENQPQYENLPGYLHSDGDFVMCLALEPSEIRELNETRHPWLTVLTFNKPLQPLRLSTQKPAGFTSIVPLDTDLVGAQYKLEFYERLQKKLVALASGELSFREYDKEVSYKIEGLKESLK